LRRDDEGISSASPPVLIIERPIAAEKGTKLSSFVIAASKRCSLLCARKRIIILSLKQSKAVGVAGADRTGRRY